MVWVCPCFTLGRGRRLLPPPVRRRAHLAPLLLHPPLVQQMPNIIKTITCLSTPQCLEHKATYLLAAAGFFQASFNFWLCSSHSVLVHINPYPFNKLYNGWILPLSHETAPANFSPGRWHCLELPIPHVQGCICPGSTDVTLGHLDLRSSKLMSSAYRVYVKCLSLFIFRIPQGSFILNDK